MDTASYIIRRPHTDIWSGNVLCHFRKDPAMPRKRRLYAIINRGRRHGMARRSRRESWRFVMRDQLPEWCGSSVDC